MTATRDELELLAKAYRQAADETFTPKAREMIDAEVRRIDAAFDELTKKIAIKFVDHDPYQSFEEMRDRVRDEKMMLVWTGASDTPLWDPMTNWKARAVHDWDHIVHGLDFSMEGEAGAFRISAARTPGLAPLYLSEIALQAAVYNFYKTFDPQKLVITTAPRVERIVRELRGLTNASEDALLPVWFVYGLYERGASDEEVMLHLRAAGASAATALPVALAGKILHASRQSPRGS